MLVTAIILACASLMLNVYQWAERRVERKEANRFVADAARLESRCQDLKKSFDNEKLHTEWAIGRIKDQQAVIDQLKHNLTPKRVYKPRKEDEK
jgi:hypothetical protein